MAQIIKLGLYRSARNLNGASQETFGVASEVRGFTRTLSQLGDKLRHTEDLVMDAGLYLERVQDRIGRFQDRFGKAQAALDTGDLDEMIAQRNHLMMRCKRL